MPSQHRPRFSAQEETDVDRGEGTGAAVVQWATERVEDEPVATVCAAFAAGFVIGMGAVAAYWATEMHAEFRHPSDHLSDRIARAVTNALPAQWAQTFQK